MKTGPFNVSGTATGARLAGLTTGLSIGVAVLFMLIAAAQGVELSIRIVPALLTIAFFGALCWVIGRHRQPGGDPRLANSAAMVLTLFNGGLAGGLICLVGQTFALPFIDPLLHRADLMLGIDLPAMINATTRIDGLPDLLAITYNSSFLLVFATALGFCWSGRTERAWELCVVFNLCLLVSTVCSAIIPAVGPFHHLGIAEEVRSALPPGSGVYHLGDLFALREATHFVIDPTELQGVATFPSFHTALALMTAAAWRDVARARVAMFAWQGLVIVSTIPIGGHYVVDLAAGAVCWALAQLWWARSSVRRAGRPSNKALPAFA